MILPATAEPEGYHAEKAKGHIKIIAAGDSYSVEMEAGVLTPAEAQAMTRHIEEIVATQP